MTAPINVLGSGHPQDVVNKVNELVSAVNSGGTNDALEAVDSLGGFVNSALAEVHTKLGAAQGAQDNILQRLASAEEALRDMKKAGA